MRRIVTALLAVLMLASPCVMCVSADGVRVTDNAGILTAYEIQRLTDSIDDVMWKYDRNVDIVVVTVNTTNGESIAEFTENYYYDNYLGKGDDKDGVLLLVNMNTDGADPEGRGLHIFLNGLCDEAVTYSELDTLIDEVVGYFTSEDYYGGFSHFVSECDYYIDIQINGEPFNWLISLAVSLLIGFVIALIVTGVMRGKLKSVRAQAAATQYVSKNGLKLTDSRDFYLYSNVVKRHIPKPPPSSGGRSGGGGGSKGGTGRF